MSLLGARLSWALVTLLMMVGYFVYGFNFLGSVCLLFGGGWLLRSTFTGKTEGHTFLFLAFAAFILVGTLLALPSMLLVSALVLSLMGLEFSENVRRQAQTFQIDPQLARIHARQVVVTGSVAWLLTTVGSFIQFNFGFWWILALAVLALLGLKAVVRSTGIATQNDQHPFEE